MIVIIIYNNIFTIPPNLPLIREACGKAKPCSPAATVKRINSSSRRIASAGLADTHTLYIAPRNGIKTIESIETAEMVAINNRPRRRIGRNGRNGLNKRSSPSCVPLLGVTCLFIPLRKQNILTRHREELHPITSLIPNHASCNSVAIYLC